MKSSLRPKANELSRRYAKNKTRNLNPNRKRHKYAHTPIDHRGTGKNPQSQTGGKTDASRQRKTEEKRKTVVSPATRRR